MLSVASVLHQAHVAVKSLHAIRMQALCTAVTYKPVIRSWDLGSEQMASAYSMKQPAAMDCSMCNTKVW